MASQKKDNTDLMDMITKELDGQHGPVTEISPEVENALLGPHNESPLPVTESVARQDLPESEGMSVDPTEDADIQPRTGAYKSPNGAGFPKKGRSHPYGSGKQSGGKSGGLNWSDALIRIESKADKALSQSDQILRMLYDIRDAKSIGGRFGDAGTPNPTRYRYQGRSTEMTPVKPAVSMLPVKLSYAAVTLGGAGQMRTWSQPPPAGQMRPLGQPVTRQEGSAMTAPPPITPSTGHHSLPSPVCFFCNMSHYTHCCTVFPDLESRIECITKAGKCGLCLTQHTTRPCQARLDSPCRFCTLTGHNLALCPNHFA